CNQFLRVCLKSKFYCKTVFKVEDGSIVHPKFGLEFRKQSILEVGDASQKRDFSKHENRWNSVQINIRLPWMKMLDYRS
uniref:Uncharacterized protein n=1 Tax=Romanomermis culicivorax TaxID=13658 RepID=A0A915HGD2_ROMCU